MEHYQNPIIPGFAPDPSVVFVDGTFFLVTSSFHLYPGLPIYASQDLKSWTLMGEIGSVPLNNRSGTHTITGSAINRPHQIDLSDATTHAFPLDTGNTMIATAGLWAPTIRHHKGRFYIVCTNCTRGGEAFLTQNFYIYTDDIWANQWSDPIFVDFKGIDPSLFFDDDDRVYFQGSWELTRERQPTCTIKQFEIDITTGRPLSEIQEIWTGAAKYDTEGPHIYRKDGFYYLIVAEGGTFEHHMLSIARSRDIWGPFESYEHNPILTSELQSGPIHHTGHGELFQDATGEWWAVVLGVRDGKGGRCPIGRETFLTAVDWPQGSWPKIHHPELTFSRVSGGQQAPALDSRLSGCLLKQACASHEDVYIRNPDPGQFVPSHEGSIVLRSSAENLSVAHGSCAFVGRRQREVECNATVELLVDASNLGTDLSAGLAVYKDCHRHAAIMFNHQDSKIWSIAVNKSRDGGPTIAWSDRVLDASAIQLQIRADEMKYEFLYRTSPDQIWTMVNSIDTLEMTARDFTGSVFGVYASGQSKGVDRRVRFEEFVVLPM